jgi:hypothetical protein
MANLRDCWPYLLESLTVSDVARLSRALCLRPPAWTPDMHALVVGKVRLRRRRATPMRDLAGPQHWKGRCRECGLPHRPAEGAFAVCRRCYGDPRAYYRLVTRSEARAVWGRSVKSANHLEALLCGLEHVKRTPTGAFLYHECDVARVVREWGGSATQKRKTGTTL